MSRDDDDSTETADYTEVKPRRGLLARSSQRLSRVVRRAKNTLDDVEMSASPKALARRVATRVKQATGRLPIERSLEALRQAILDPRTAQTMQQIMLTLGQAGLSAAFRQEPHAHLMFEFAEWCSTESSRGHVMAILVNDAVQPDGAVGYLYTSLLGAPAGGNPFIVLTRGSPGAHLDKISRSIQLSLMRTLCDLAMTATGAELMPRDAELFEFANAFRDAKIPEEYVPLADFALGIEPNTETDSNTKSTLPVRSELTTSQLRHVITAYLVFVETYLLRNMVDALPAMMDALRDEASKRSEGSEASSATTLDMDGRK